MSISMIQMQAALARTDDVAKIEQSKQAIRARQVERQKQRGKEIANERIDTISEALEENVVEKIGSENHQQKENKSNTDEKANKDQATRLPYRDLDLGSHIDLSV